jgi:hypothetical protein
MNPLPFSIPRLAALLAGLALGTPAAAQTTVSFQDGAQPGTSYAGSSDTYISQEEPDANKAAETTLLVDGDNPSGSGKDLVMLLRWDVSAIPTNATVQSAALVFNVVNSSPQSYGVFEVKRAWSSGQATWNQASTGTAWGAPGASGSTDRGTTVLGSLAFNNVTGTQTVALNSAGVSVVQGWVGTPASNHGLLVAGSGNNDGVDVRSGNDATASLRPLLRVTYTTTTPPPPPGAAVLIAAGDIAEKQNGVPEGAEITAQLVEGLLAQNPGAKVAALGDLVYPGGQVPGTNPFTDMYAPTWGRFRSVTLPVIGNHEYHDGASDWAATPTNYANYFGAAAGPAGRYYYAQDLGPWKVLVLNSNCAGTREDQRCSHDEQMTWLQGQLQAATNKCVMAVFHHPVYGTQSYSSNTYLLNRLKEYWQVLYDANVDVILAGHAHTYERLKPLRPDGTVDTVRGIREFIVGTGGAHLGGGTANNRHDKLIRDVYGVLKLTLRDTGYDWRFYPQPGSSATDSGSGDCH